MDNSDDTLIHKEFIKSSYSIHDRTHFEAIFRYPFFSATEDEVHNYTFELNTYFLFPHQIMPEEESYPRESFYKNLKALVRLRQPKLSFMKIMGDPDSNEPTPAAYLASYLEKAKRNDPKIDTPKFAVNEVRLWACAFYRYFFRHLRKHLQRPNEIAPHELEQVFSQEHWTDNIQELLVNGDKIIKHIAELRLSYENAKIDSLQEVITELKYAEEYCLYIYLDCLATVKYTFEKLKKLKIIYPELIQLTDTYIVKKRALATESYPYYPDENSSVEVLETYVVRRGFLKKRMQSVLYLDVRQKPLFQIQRQMGAMVAAGFAAFWWISAQLLLLNMNASNTLTLQNMTSGGFLIFTAFIFAYILKDRIKESGRRRFDTGIIRRLADHSNDVYYQPDSQQEILLGKINEYASKRKKSDLPPDIIEALNENTLAFEEDVQRKVIHYRKTFAIKPKNLIKNKAARLRAIHDILRFNFSQFLHLLDDPTYNRLAIDSDNQVVSLRLPKSYYVHMLMEYSIYENAKNKSASYLDVVRLVINKTGLVRVEILTKNYRGLTGK